MEFFIFKERTIHGPYSWEELQERWRNGEYSPNDLARGSDDQFWTPLRRFQTGDTMADLANRWTRHSATRVWVWVGREPVKVGLIWVVLGCVIFILTHVPILLFGPPLAMALVAGGVAIIQGRLLSGIGICMAAVFIPAILSVLFWPRA